MRQEQGENNPGIENQEEIRWPVYVSRRNKGVRSGEPLNRVEESHQPVEVNNGESDTNQETSEEGLSRRAFLAWGLGVTAFAGAELVSHFPQQTAGFIKTLGRLVATESNSKPVVLPTPIPSASFSPFVEPTPTLETIPNFDFSPDLENAKLDVLDGMRALEYEASTGDYSPELIARLTRTQVLKEGVFARTKLQHSWVSVESPDLVTIDENRYDLMDPTSRTLAEAILSSDISTQRNDLVYGSYITEDMQRIAQLKGRISFVDTNQVMNIDSSNFASLAPTLEGFEAHNISYPKRWAIAPRGASPKYDQSTDTLYFNGSNPPESLATYLKVKDPDFYDAFVKTMIVLPTPTGDTLGLSSLEYADVQYSLSEDFTATLRAYLLYGQGFRNKIEYAAYKGDKLAENLLRAKYGVMKSFFGYETSQDGQSREVYQPQKGEIAQVYEYGPKVGVWLKPTPRWDKDPRWDAVRDGEEVMVVDGPTPVVYEFPSDGNPDWLYPQVMDYVKVQPGYMYKNKWQRVTNNNDKLEEGWMPVQYLAPQQNIPAQR